MPLFIRKPTVVEAEQFTNMDKPPRGVRWDGEMFFVTTIQGVDIRVGLSEWIVTEAGGKHFYPVNDAEFKRIYQPTK